MPYHAAPHLLHLSQKLADLKQDGGAFELETDATPVVADFEAITSRLGIAHALLKSAMGVLDEALRQDRDTGVRLTQTALSYLSQIQELTDLRVPVDLGEE